MTSSCGSYLNHLLIVYAFVYLDLLNSLISLKIVIGLTMLSDHRKLFQVVPDDVKHIGNEWAVHGLIVIRLVSQITLTLLGNERKYNPRTRVRMALFAYLLALAVASSALGVITRTALDVCSNTSHFSSEDTYKQNTSQLMSFWAPFLLLHLGGPDAITVVALEDNELSLRHFIEIVFQFSVALYIFLLSRPGCSDLPKLSVLVYLAGFIKCFGRIKALRLAKTENLRESMLGPPDAEGKEISEAYYLLQTFKRLFVDLILTFEDKDSSQSYFRHLKSSNAFCVVEIELGFSFHMLYTKANVVYTFNGLLLRLTCISVQGLFDLLSVALDERLAWFRKTQIFLKINKVREQHRDKTYNKVSDNLKQLSYSQFNKYMVVNTNLKELCTHKDVGNEDGSDIDICRTETKHISDVSDYLMYRDTVLKLALTLKKMGKERMWKVMSQVWIEILAYAATYCRGFHHQQQLRKGGEFLHMFGY
ncbi:hypothetical protein Tco_0168382 [Tanacetum coccineum]